MGFLRHGYKSNRDYLHQIKDFYRAQKTKTYEQTGKSISRFDFNKKIPILKASSEWLGEVNSQSLQGMTKQVESAFTRFFREKKWIP